MTETEATQQETTASSYEQLRDSAPKDAKIEWRDGDKWAGHVREKLSELAADESLSDSGKHERVQYHLEVAATRIERGYERAAQILEKEAKRKALASVPLPDGHDLNSKVKDNAELLALQGEMQSIVSKVEAKRAQTPKGMKAPDPASDVLRNAYASAMEDGGVEGMARARGVLRACEQLGVPVDDVVVNPYRERQHYEAADEARRLEYLRKQVPSAEAMTLSNPFRPETGPKGEYHTGRGGNIFRPCTATVDKGTRRKP